MIYVIATVAVAEGRRLDFLKEFHKVVPHVRAEKGCIEYGAAVDLPTDIPDPGRCCCHYRKMVGP
jgi:quinol monooxygenase YgiN